LLTKNGPYNAQKINRSRKGQTETALQNFETPFLISEVPSRKSELRLPSGQLT